MGFEILTGFCAKLLYSRRITDHFLRAEKKKHQNFQRKHLTVFMELNIYIISLHHSVLSFCIAFTGDTAFTITKKLVVKTGVERKISVPISTLFGASKML